MNDSIPLEKQNHLIGVRRAETKKRKKVTTLSKHSERAAKLGSRARKHAGAQ